MRDSVAAPTANDSPFAPVNSSKWVAPLLVEADVGDLRPGGRPRLCLTNGRCDSTAALRGRPRGRFAGLAAFDCVALFDFDFGGRPRRFALRAMVLRDFFGWLEAFDFLVKAISVERESKKQEVR